MPETAVRNKLCQKLFIGLVNQVYILLVHITSCFLYCVRYMARRFKFLEQCYFFIYNVGVGHKSIQSADNKVVMQYTNTILLGKTLIEAMLKEVDNMISQESSQCDWSNSVHQQVCISSNF